MSGLGVLFACLFLQIGPNDYLIERQLLATDPVTRRFLPVDRLRSPIGTLWLVFHDRKDWARAFSLEPAAGQPSMALQADRLLPGLVIRRLVLVKSYLQQNGHLKPLQDLPVDSFEWYVHALLEARVESSAEAEIGRRAEEVMADVPLEFKGTAFKRALDDFLAHVLSIAHQLARARNRGHEICSADLPLPRLWRRAFEEGVFPGTWQVASELKTSSGVLRLEDKLWAVRIFLGKDWQVRLHDFDCR